MLSITAPLAGGRDGDGVGFSGEKNCWCDNNGQDEEGIMGTVSGVGDGIS